MWAPSLPAWNSSGVVRTPHRTSGRNPISLRSILLPRVRSQARRMLPGFLKSPGAASAATIETWSTRPEPRPRRTPRRSSRSYSRASGESGRSPFRPRRSRNRSRSSRNRSCQKRSCRQGFTLPGAQRLGQRTRRRPGRELLVHDRLCQRDEDVRLRREDLTPVRSQGSLRGAEHGRESKASTPSPARP